MLKKIIAYSLTAILLGIVLMLVPILLIFPLSLLTVTSKHFLNITEGSEKTTFTANITRGLSIDELSKFAQSYGRSEITTFGSNEAIGEPSTLTPLTLLIPLVIVTSAGLLSAITVKLIVCKAIFR